MRYRDPQIRMRAQPPDLGVAVSNGFHKMHLATAAREANDRGLLKLLVTGAYPTPAFRRLLRALPVRGPARLRRVEDRDEEIPLGRVQVLFLPELLEQLARRLARVPLLRRLSEKLTVATYRLYGRKAARALARAHGAQIFHFRAGFGGSSIDKARELGMLILCDEALVHPRLFGILIDDRGRMPSRESPLPPPADEISKAALEDLDRSDAVVVSSPFVKETFMRAGWSPERVHVAYTGIDENFFHYGELPVPRRSAPTGPLPLLFASVLSRRKGAETLVEALELVGSRIDWDLVVAGPVAPDIAAKHRPFFADPRVEVLGNLARPEFKAQLIARGVFPFPSNAEGSARAVWEALACGCYVITTPNAGSIVEDGVHGALVPPGDAEALAEAIIAADADRERIAEIGNRNAELIASSYRQSAYGDALTRIYADLAQGEGHTSSVPAEASAPRNRA
jgi:glycosyltransferase involved in cell wall biosynthesis